MEALISSQSRGTHCMEALIKPIIRDTLYGSFDKAIYIRDTLIIVWKL